MNETVKRLLIVAGVFFGTAAMAVWLLTGGAAALGFDLGGLAPQEAEEASGATIGPAAKGSESRPPRPALGTAAEPASSSEASASVAADTQGDVELRITVAGRDGYPKAPVDLELVVRGLTPTLEQLAPDSWLVRDLPAGRHIFQARATGCVPSKPWELVVVAGRTIADERTLEYGETFAGLVEEARYGGVVAGATVHFKNGVRVQTGPDGRFRVAEAMPRSMLDGILVTHPEFDRVQHSRLAGAIPSELRLAMAWSGTSELQLRVNSEEHPNCRVSLEKQTGVGQYMLVRERRLKTGEPLLIKALRDGPYRLVLHPPAGAMTARRAVPFQLERDERTTLDVELSGGASAAIQLLMHGGEPGAGRICFLLNAQGSEVVRGPANAEGVFVARGLVPGRYRLILEGIRPTASTPWFEVSEEDPNAAIALVFDQPAGTWTDG